MSFFNPSKRTKRKLKLWSIFVGKILFTLLLIGIVAAGICAVVFAVYINKNIDPKLDIEVAAMKLNYSSIVYYIDKDGKEQELERLYDTQNRTWADLDNMPVHLKNAAIAIEDERFEKHHGVDWKRTVGATLNLFFKMRSDFGGSTITQQLIKNLTGDKQDTVSRKVQEIMRALYLERHYTKETIVELYLNTIYLGEGCYGVKTAAEVYFGKDISELTLAECASLIGITNLPTYYDPFINPENNKKRQVYTLNNMRKLKKITKAEYDKAINEKLVFKHDKRAEENTSKQSYFVDQVIEDVIHDLMQEHGYSYQVAERTIFSGGLKIYATIDPKVQNAMDEVLQNDKNFPKFKSSVQPECAMVVMDQYTGNVLGIVGGRGKKTSDRILNRATQTFRSPGSAIKPLSVYAPAIEYGLINPQSPEDDAPMRVYRNSAYPKNETRTYSGRINILKGVMESINTISMRTLDKLSTERSYNFLNANLGISSLDRSRDMNLAPLALGALTKGVTVLEMAAAYSAFPNDGTYIEPRTYTKVVDNQGKTILENTPKVIDAMSEKTAAYMNYMLQKVVSGGTGVKARLSSGIPAAGKTGTSNNDQDRWFVGYTPYYTGACWFGYDKPKYLTQTLSPALTTWKKVMDKIHQGLPMKKFSQPDDFVYVNVCSCSGKLPTKWCALDPRGSRIIRGYFHKDDVPTKYCDVHVPVVIDSSTMQIASSSCPDSFKKTIALMDLKRYFIIPGVVLGDEQYTLRKYTDSGNPESLPAGKYYYSVPSGKAINSLCSAHRTSIINQPIIAEPGDTQTPDISQENGSGIESEEPDNTQKNSTEKTKDNKKTDTEYETVPVGND